jgi:hypothetical protein
MRLVHRPCRKLRHSQCHEPFCCCMCHFENWAARFWGPEYAHPMADGERRGVCNWGMARTVRDPGRPLEGDPWHWRDTVMSVPAWWVYRRFRWQQARMIAREERLTARQ